MIKTVSSATSAIITHLQTRLLFSSKVRTNTRVIYTNKPI